MGAKKKKQHTAPKPRAKLPARGRAVSSRQKTPTRAELRAARERSEAVQRGWETRRANAARAERAERKAARERSQRAVKGWETRRQKAHAAAVAKFDKSERARERRLERRWHQELVEKRAAIVGPTTLTGGLHGKDRNDWFVLRAKMTAQEPDWLEFRMWADEHGFSGDEAADEWFSPEM